MRNAIKKMLRLLTRPYYWMRGTSFVWYRILNRRSRALYVANPPVLDRTQRCIVDELLANGCAVTDIGELFPGTDHFSRLTAYAAHLRPQATAKTKKHYLLQLIDLVPVLDPEDPLARFAVDDRMLSIVNAYCGVYTRLNHLSLDLSMPVSAGAKPEESQRWHRDPEDRIMCKMFLYFTDVDGSSGPLHYIAGSHMRGKWRGLFPQRPPRGVYPPDGAVEQRVPAGDIKRFTGEKGMIVFCDTSGLHKGGYGTGRERLAATFTYSSDAGFMMDRLRLPDGRGWQAEELSPQQRFATGSRLLFSLDNCKF